MSDETKDVKHELDKTSERTSRSKRGSVVLRSPRGNQYVIDGKDIERFKQSHGVDARWEINKRG